MEGLLVSALFWEQVFARVGEPESRTPVRPVTVRERMTQRPAQKFSTVQRRRPSRPSSTARPISSQKKTANVVVFSPHPDDEILCCSERIENRMGEGARVQVIFFTDGDGLGADSTHDEARQYGQQRRRESRRTARMLGLGKSDLYFLGFPDGHLDKLSDNEPLRSAATGYNRAPFGSAFSHAPYTRGALKKNLKTLLTRLQPTEVYLPSERYDKHPDHQATARIAHEVLREMELTPTMYEYTVHGRRFTNAEPLVENDKKLRLVRMFRSQFHDRAHRDFMERFAEYEEEFR